MDDDDDLSQLLIHYSFSFSMCRLSNNLLLPSNIEVKADVAIMDEDEVGDALRKINYWIDEYVNGAIAVSASSAGVGLILDSDNTPRLQNYIMITPYEPNDNHLGMILQSKLQSLANGAFLVGMIEITSNNSGGLAFTYIGDAETDLPTMEEWMSGRTWFDKPWWARDDSSMFDSLAGPDADITIKPSWATDLNFILRDDTPQEAIVLAGNFSPRIVDEDDNVS